MTQPMTTGRAAPPAITHRTWALDDISIRSDGDGRIVDAYASVFDIEAPVSDFEGQGYIEVARRGSFVRTIEQRMSRMQVIYNHGLDIYGAPASQFSQPLGVVLDMREDGKGVRTSVRYSTTPLADDTLTLIRDGAIRGMSWGGAWIRSNPGRGPYRRGQLVERTEAAMREFGPTPFPVFADADIIGVRSLSTLVEEIDALTPEERAELARIIAGTPPADPADPGTVEGDPPAPGTDTVPAEPTEDLEADLQLIKAQLALTDPTKGT